jgi:hypothetical protein
VPTAASREETAELLDRALRLIEEAQALADAKRSASAPTEQYIRDWRESRSRLGATRRRIDRRSELAADRSWALCAYD